MSITRWFLYASFAGGIIALSLQPSGIANASKTSAFLVTDQSPGSSQDTQRDSRSGKKGMSDAESSGKMQSDKDALPGDGRMGKNSKIIDQSREKGTSQGSGQPDSTSGESSGSSTKPGSSHMGSDSGMSGSGTGAGSR